MKIETAEPKPFENLDYFLVAVFVGSSVFGLKLIKIL